MSCRVACISLQASVYRLAYQAIIAAGKTAVQSLHKISAKFARPQVLEVSVEYGACLSETSMFSSVMAMQPLCHILLQK